MTEQRSFVEKLSASIERNNSLLCVGLDPDPRKYPAYFSESIDTEALFNWGRNIIEQTSDLVCCYKPNSAFYEQYGPAGFEALRQTIAAVPEDIPVLGISAGEIDVQRLFYWHVAKAFYDPRLGIEEMNHINFDWFSPVNAHRQSPAEVRSWCDDVGLRIDREVVEHAGITIIATKR